MKGNILNFTAETAVPAFRFVKAGAADGNVQLAGSGDAVVGVSMDEDAAEGNRVDVQFDGIGQVTLGESVAYGAPLASDAEGRGVTATSESYGIALDSGVEGDIVRVKLATGGTVAAEDPSEDGPSDENTPDSTEPTENSNTEGA